MATEAHGKTQNIRSSFPCLPCGSVAIHHASGLTKRIQIIEEMVRFQIASLSPSIPKSRSVAMQSEIQELQRQALAIKTSCRELIMKTFTAEQWENFAFVVSDNPKFASLMLQANTLTIARKH